MPRSHWNHKEGRLHQPHKVPCSNLGEGSREEVVLWCVQSEAPSMAPPWSPKPLCVPSTQEASIAILDFRTARLCPSRRQE